jgi:hypothetical protein
MSDTANTSKNPEEEKKALIENPPLEENTDVKTEVDGELSEITTATSEAKVRHDTVK